MANSPVEWSETTKIKKITWYLYRAIQIAEKFHESKDLVKAAWELVDDIDRRHITQKDIEGIANKEFGEVYNRIRQITDRD